MGTLSSQGRAEEKEAVEVEGGREDGGRTGEGGSTSQQRHSSRVRMPTRLDQTFTNNVKSKRLNHSHFAIHCVGNSRGRV